MLIKYKLKRRVIEKLRIVYASGYVHELWVYNLKVSKDGQYTWLHYDPGNRIIDLQPENIISIFVVKRKTRFYWSKIRVRKPPTPKMVLDQFKPKPSTKKDVNQLVKVSDDVHLELTTNDPNKFGY